MFLEGLKLALGLVTGLGLFAGILGFVIIGPELFAHWRKKHRRRLWETKACALRRAMPRFRERAVFQFSYRTNDWISTPDKSEHLQ
jgi:hypothetical protein